MISDIYFILIGNINKNRIKCSLAYWLLRLIMSEKVPYDDDSANMYQHSLPRISGGGRKLNSNFNYECLWCPKDVIRLGKKGRFREIKSYKRHFMEYHHGVNGVSMTDFVERVQRNEPTWFCEVCNRHYSLDNEIRHRAICKPNQLSTENDDEDPRETNAKQKQDNSKKSSTAGQYANRIIEFFNFMANKYKGFHLDWFVDYKEEIKKTYPDGTDTNEIFFPTKYDVTEFIKQFKYGGTVQFYFIFRFILKLFSGNPAANCGIRIFALKKLCDFLSKEITNNDHQIIGTIIQKRDIVRCLVERLKSLNDSICPAGTIKHLATASNKSHKKTILEQTKLCPERSMETIMDGVKNYINSEEFKVQQNLLIELACKKGKVPSASEYMNSTEWLLEQLVCIGGNRPCALLGITVKDWAERRPGYCPFYQEVEENELQEDDATYDKRMVLKNPYNKPKGSKENETTGVIVRSETDKICVGAPCYIWFPNSLAALVNDHSLMAQKIIPRSVDIYHPRTKLFLNSQGKEIKTIKCKHFKNFIGLPITAYDFRRSLSTFCLEHDNEFIRSSEKSVLRHNEETGYGYYYQKHSQKVEYVAIQYAMQHGLIKANMNDVDKHGLSLRKSATNEEWDLSQKRTEKSIEYSQELDRQKKKGIKDSQRKGGRTWILAHEYDSFIEGIEEAISIEEKNLTENKPQGPFINLLNYKHGTKGAGIFPPLSIWKIDMFRVLYGLSGEKGDAMRRAELSVYDGIPFTAGLTGRKKIASELNKGRSINDTDEIIASYWLEKIKREARQIYDGKWIPLRFVFTENQLKYNIDILAKNKKNS